MKSKRSPPKKVDAPVVEAPVEEKMPEIEDEVEEEDEEDENGETPEASKEKETPTTDAEKLKMQKQRQAEIEILQNDGVFRVELLYQLTELNKNFLLLNMELQKLLGEEK